MTNSCESEPTLKDMYEFMKSEFSKLNSNYQEIKEQLSQQKEVTIKLEEKVKTLEDENKEMKVEINNLKSGVNTLERNVNDREQYARSWSVRISGLKVPKEEEERLGKDRAVMKWSYDKILKPILNAAKTKGDIETVPSAYHTLLENGHYIYKKQRGRAADGGEDIPHIIVRFCSRHMRNVVLRNKKASTPTPTSAEVVAGVKKYSIYEDLTAANYKLLKSAIDDKRILRAWTVDGKLRFVEEGDPSKVKTLGKHRTVEEFFK